MPDLDQAQQASAASIPALRAVIADVSACLMPVCGCGCRCAEHLDCVEQMHALAAACERLAEENERLRWALEFTDDIWACFKLSALKTELVHNVKLARRTITEALRTPAPAGKGEG